MPHHDLIDIRPDLGADVGVFGDLIGDVLGYFVDLIGDVLGYFVD